MDIWEKVDFYTYNQFIPVLYSLFAEMLDNIHLLVMRLSLKLLFSFKDEISQKDSQ